MAQKWVTNRKRWRRKILQNICVRCKALRPSKTIQKYSHLHSTKAPWTRVIQLSNSKCRQWSSTSNLTDRLKRCRVKSRFQNALVKLYWYKSKPKCSNTAEAPSNQLLRTVMRAKGKHFRWLLINRIKGERTFIIFWSIVTRARIFKYRWAQKEFTTTRN